MSDTPRTSPTEPTNRPLGASETGAAGAGREPRGFTTPGAEGQMKSQAKQAGAAVQSAADQVSQTVSQGLDMAQDRVQDLQRWANDQHETARERIREHPISSVAITFGAGMLLGLLLARR